MSTIKKIRDIISIIAFYIVIIIVILFYLSIESDIVTLSCEEIKWKYPWLTLRNYPARCL